MGLLPPKRTNKLISILSGMVLIWSRNVLLSRLVVLQVIMQPTMKLEPFHRTSGWNLKRYWWLGREDGITKQTKGARECEVWAPQHTQLHGMVPNFAHLANAFKLGMKQGLVVMHFCTHVLSWFNLGFNKDVASHHTATFLSNTMSMYLHLQSLGTLSFLHNTHSKSHIHLLRKALFASCNWGRNLQFMLYVVWCCWFTSHYRSV